MFTANFGNLLQKLRQLDDIRRDPPRRALLRLLNFVQAPRLWSTGVGAHTVEIDGLVSILCAPEPIATVFGRRKNVGFDAKPSNVKFVSWAFHGRD